MRASLIYSVPSTSSMAERVRRIKPVTANHPSVNPGKRIWAGVPRPEVGKTPGPPQDEYQNQPEPERWHCLPQRRHAPAEIVEGTVAPHRGIDADGQSQSQDDQNSQTTELQRRRIALSDNSESRAIKTHGAAEISLHRPADEPPVLHRPGAISPR